MPNRLRQPTGLNKTREITLMSIKGFTGQLLRVDLTTGEIKKESLPDESVLREYLGGIGLGMRIILDEVDHTLVVPALT